MNALKNYSQKLIELDLFKKSNTQLFFDYENLQKELENLRIELQKEVKENGDVQDEFTKATRVERWHKYYSWDLFVASASKIEKKCLMEAGGVNVEINKDVFNECVKQGLINQDTKQAVFKEELSSVAVIIKHLI